MRYKEVLVCCDYTLSPAEQQWKVVEPIIGGDPQIVNICYALGLIEGAISMTPVSPMTSRGHGLN
jgi:hypothetical protein